MPKSGGGSMAFKKRIGRNGKQVDTLAFSGEDEIALDYPDFGTFLKIR